MRAPKQKRNLSRLSDRDLLALRFCDLPLKAPGARVTRAVARLRRELRARGLKFVPHVWLAEEWFSPDGVAGFAVPFYLAHPRLLRLERAMSRQVEGGNSNWLMRILRHETGHAIDNAYHLRRRRRWREVFGPASLRYPSRYRARPGSRRYVHHLGDWYAQAHPTEDFAETFGVWLGSSAWRRQYADWPAMHKLTLVDELMRAVRARAPCVTRRQEVEPLRTNTRTLAEHYRRRAKWRVHHRRGRADEQLRRIFATTRPRASALSAFIMLRRHRKSLARQVMCDCAVDRYTAHQMLRMIADCARRTPLYQRGSQRDCLRHLRWLLADLTKDYLQAASPTLSL